MEKCINRGYKMVPIYFSKMSSRFRTILPLVLLTVTFSIIPQNNTDPLTGAIARPNPRPRPNPTGRKSKFKARQKCIFMNVLGINLQWDRVYLQDVCFQSKTGNIIIVKRMGKNTTKAILTTMMKITTKATTMIGVCNLNSRNHAQ